MSQDVLILSITYATGFTLGHKSVFPISFPSFSFFHCWNFISVSIENVCTLVRETERIKEIQTCSMNLPMYCLLLRTVFSFFCPPPPPPRRGWDGASMLENCFLFLTVSQRVAQIKQILVFQLQLLRRV